MAIIRCKMCGGDLALVPGQSVAECENCGRLQTVPAADNEKKLTLFARANRLRAGCEFDKAAGVYEAIVADFPEEAEAYWGLVLCSYGIEYVDDPATGKKVPTCHRSSFDSIMDDNNFEMALEYADVVARRVYREEAKQLEEIRKGIISVSANEEPYDIFICYKETDPSGDRTLDSVLAQDIYDALTDKDYRVFFARITLEDKLGTEYEPYIFAALNSAKIMLVVGTDYEYFNAVWVKNEWSRFLKLMAKDREKHLIPCFKGIDAYDMPREFARLQAQDLGKVGAIQDLLRGIGKLMPKQEQNTVVIQTVNTNASAMVMRGQFALDDGEFDKAAEYFERALDQNPQDGDAYLGKVLAALHLSNAQQLDNYLVKLHDDKDFDRAIRFTNPATSRVLTQIRDRVHKKYLVKCLTVALKKRGRQIEAEEKSRKTKFEQAQERMRSAETEFHYNYAALMFKSLGDYPGAEENYRKCMDAAELAKQRKAEEDARLAAEAERRAREEALRQQEAARRAQAEEDRRRAFDMLREPHDVRSARQVISGREKHSVAIRVNGTVVAAGDNDYGRCNVNSWRDIVSVSTGRFHTVGLRADGTVVAVGDDRYDKTKVSAWRNVISVSAGDFGTVALKKDGTVYAIGSDMFHYNQVAKWTGICAISAGACHTVGLKRDGTVVCVGDNTYGQCNVTHWRDIIAISARGHHTLGLKADGTVVVNRYSGPGNEYRKQCEVQGWQNLADISAGAIHSAGLRPDGRVIVTPPATARPEGHLNVGSWWDISAVCCCMRYTLGLRRDGTMVACGQNDFGQCNVQLWRELMQPPVARTMAQQLAYEAEQSAARQNLYTLWDAEERKRAALRHEGRCQYCGGIFKGMFGKKCANCGRSKDY